MTAKSARTTKAKADAVVAPYKPTPQEDKAVRAFLTRRAEKRPAPGMKFTYKDGKATQIALDHPDKVVGDMLLTQAFGTTSFAFSDGLLRQLLNAGSQDPQASERDLNFMLAVVTGLEPRDEIEAMLAAQMAAVHSATMTFARRLNHVENIPQQDSAARAFNTLARTFAAQIEALKRYRTGGEQKVTVQHVTVNEGGQAVVGNVSQAPGGGRPGRKVETTS